MGGRMDVEESLREAAILGNVESLNQVLEKDPLILDRISAGSLVHTPLHLAALRGHLEFVRRLLSKNPHLAGVLDQRRWSALHLAAAQGHCSVVKELVQANPNMRTVVDADGRNPLHLATIKGDIDLLIELLEAQPDRIGELLSTRDANDDTVLHLAVKNLQFETLVFFLYTIKAMVAKPTNNEQVLNTINKYGFTPLDILEQTDRNEDKIYTLRAAGCLKAKEMNQGEWLSKQRKSLMVVASLIATMTFQAALSPPGGYWQDNKKEHRAGENVIASNRPTAYSNFLLFNSTGFFGSIMTIFFLVIGEPFFTNTFVTKILVLSMLQTVACTVVAYTLSILATTSKKDRQPDTYAVIIWGWTFCVSMLVLLLGRYCWLANELRLTENKTQSAWKEAEKTVKEIKERGTAILVQQENFPDMDANSRQS